MIRIATLGSVALLGLSACNSPEPAPPASAPSVPQTPTPPAPANALTAEGYGPLRIGMTRAEVIAAMGANDNPNTVGGPDPESCDMFHPARAPEGLYVMVENGVLTSVQLGSTSVLKTDRGLGIGDTAAAVKQAYGPDARVSPHKYADAPAEYVTTWTTTDHDSPAARGVRYNIGADGRVQGVAVGGPSILYVEGCA
ncbi:hypothetical protein [uncultured Brevundimonas sp.]|uniref:hypothetical protein n=1 Tax=uncultured Brevundimonas sp. TaxID=213418 RepID=UPI0030ED912D|tara:strand:+ start:60606 stop:61196 length:591 start_codon:yes stop_codon:yes gene_type:complete